MADSKYQSALNKMGVIHGGDYDCNRECQKCQPYRDIERAAWLALTDEEKEQVRFYAFRV